MWVGAVVTRLVLGDTAGYRSRHCDAGGPVMAVVLWRRLRGCWSNRGASNRLDSVTVMMPAMIVVVADLVIVVVVVAAAAVVVVVVVVVEVLGSV